MWIVYRSENLEIVGLTAHGTLELPREDAIAGVVVSDDAAAAKAVGALLVRDSQRAHEIMAAHATRRLSLRPGTEEPAIVIAPVREFHLALTCDAPDVHPVDGIPEIAADGKAFTLITVLKLDVGRKPVSGKEHDDQLYLRTTHGTLQNATGKEEVSRIKLKNGKAELRLRSEAARRVATVRVFNADKELRDATIQIEFI